MRTQLRSIAISLALALMLPFVASMAAESGPYDEQADARADLNRALQQAATEHKDVLVVFGANWCKDCLSLAGKMASGDLAWHVASRYVVTKVDVARFNKNVDLSAQMGDPIKKGIPAVAVLHADGSLVKATTGGELADARSMGDTEVLAVLSGLQPGTRQ